MVPSPGVAGRCCPPQPEDSRRPRATLPPSGFTGRRPGISRPGIWITADPLALLLLDFAQRGAPKLHLSIQRTNPAEPRDRLVTLAPVRFHGVNDSDDLPALICFEEADGIDSTMSEFAVAQEFIFAPDLGHAAANGNLRAARKPLHHITFGGGDPGNELVARPGGRRSVAPYRIQPCVGQHRGTNHGGIMSRHSVEGFLDRGDGFLFIRGLREQRSHGSQQNGRKKGTHRSIMHRPCKARIPTSASTGIGALKPKAAMLLAIMVICVFEWCRILGMKSELTELSVLDQLCHGV